MTEQKNKNGLVFTILGCCFLPIALASGDPAIKYSFLSLSVVFNIIGLVLSLKNNNKQPK
jgi:hypothetical protein